MSDPGTSLDTSAPDLTLRPAFAPCATCGRLLLIRVWQHERGWRDLAHGVTPCLGNAHETCPPHNRGD